MADLMRVDWYATVFRQRAFAEAVAGDGAGTSGTGSASGTWGPSAPAAISSTQA